MNIKLEFYSVVFAIICLFISCTRDINKTASFRDIFDHYRDQQGITAFSIPPSLVGLIMNQSDEGDNDLATLMKDLSAFKIIILEGNGKNQGMKDEMFHVINDFTLRNGFNDFFVMRNREENIMISVKENKDIISEAIILFTGEEGLTVINLRGNIKPENIAKLIDSGVIHDIEGWYIR